MQYIAGARARDTFRKGEPIYAHERGTRPTETPFAATGQTELGHEKRRWYMSQGLVVVIKAGWEVRKGFQSLACLVVYIHFQIQ